MGSFDVDVEKLFLGQRSIVGMNLTSVSTAVAVERPPTHGALALRFVPTPVARSQAM